MCDLDSRFATLLPFKQSDIDCCIRASLISPLIIINKRLQKDLRKEVETGKNGTQKYVVKQGENKGKIL